MPGVYAHHAARRHLSMIGADAAWLNARIEQIEAAQRAIAEGPPCGDADVMDAADAGSARLATTLEYLYRASGDAEARCP